MKQQLKCQFTKRLAWHLQWKKGQIMGQLIRNRQTEPGIPPPHPPLLSSPFNWQSLDKYDQWPINCYVKDNFCFFFFQYQGSISSLLRSISNALCTVNGELINGDQLLVPGEKSGKSSHATSTQTFKIDIFTEEVIWICYYWWNHLVVVHSSSSYGLGFSQP